MELKILCSPFVHPSGHLFWQLLIFLLSTVLPFPECHRVRTKHYVAFSDWFLSVSNMHLSFLHDFYGLMFLVLNNIPLYGYSIVHLSIHLQGYLGCLQVLANYE